MNTTTTLSVALKEWDLVCSALLDGTQMILLRKGGILEAANEFELEHKRFLLFPTFIHQDPRMLKEAFRKDVVTTRTEPQTVTLKGFGEAVRIFEVPRTGGRAAVDRLRGLHMWDEPLIDMRFAYRPEKPLYVVIVRGWRLPEPVVIENTIEYAGCKSWVPLEREVDVSQAVAAVSEERLAGVVAEVADALGAPARS